MTTGYYAFIHAPAAYHTLQDRSHYLFYCSFHSFTNPTNMSYDCSIHCSRHQSAPSTDRHYVHDTSPQIRQMLHRNRMTIFAVHKLCRTHEESLESQQSWCNHDAVIHSLASQLLWLSKIKNDPPLDSMQLLESQFLDLSNLQQHVSDLFSMSSWETKDDLQKQFLDATN